MLKLTTCSFLLIFCVALTGCSDSSDQNNEADHPQPGEYYWVFSDEGDCYKVFKVLVVETHVIHFCYYNNLFEEQPEKDVIPSLYFGTPGFGNTLLDRVGNKTTSGCKHMAVIRKVWANWEPHFLDIGEVTSDDLDAYEKWKNGDRHIFRIELHPPSN